MAPQQEEGLLYAEAGSRVDGESKQEISQTPLVQLSVSSLRGAVTRVFSKTDAAAIRAAIVTGARADSLRRSDDTTLEWHIKELRVRVKEKGSSYTDKFLLSDVVGTTRSGQLTAIMGASGCGKTCLIECLALRNRSFEGALRMNGKPARSTYLTDVAFVPQKDMLFGFLTVREHLGFHVATKLGSQASAKERLARVYEVMHAMGLVDGADTLIGGTNPTFMRKGLSGGERKRLVIATELLQCPSILLLDEPTTGLDSVRCLDVVSALSELTTKKRIIVMASVHNPSGEAAKLFTHLLLLTSDGRIAYHGPMAGALDYFATLGYVLPPLYSATDFYLRISSMNPHKPRHDEEARLDRLVSTFAASDLRHRPALPVDHHHQAFTSAVGVKVSRWEMFLLNLRRCLVQTQRDLLSTVLCLAVFLVLGLLLGLIFLNTGGSNWRSMTGYTFTVVVSLLMTTVLSGVVRFPPDWATIVDECRGGSNAIGPFIVAKYAAELPYTLGYWLMITVSYFMTGMERAWRPYLWFLLIGELVALSSSALGFLIASLSANPTVVFTLSPCFMLPMVMFSGLLYQRSSIAPYLLWCSELSIVNFGFGSLIAVSVHLLPLPQQHLLLGFAEIDPSALPMMVSRLAILLVACLLLAYLCLRWRISSMGRA